jgi:hypothetical protein
MDEVNTKLDLEWEAHVEKCRTGGQRPRAIPSKDTMYRALLNSTNIIESQKSVLDKLSLQVRQKNGKQIRHFQSCLDVVFFEKKSIFFDFFLIFRKIRFKKFRKFRKKIIIIS